MHAQSRFGRRDSRRNGLTLIEILLVLALLVAIGTLVLPNLRGPLDNQKLRKSGDLIRSVWATARIQAMKTGQIQMFRFQNGGTDYQFEPYYTQQDSLEFGDLDQSQQPGFGGQGGFGNTPTGPLVQTLPDGVRFAGTAMEVDARSLSLEQQAGAFGQNLQTTGMDGALSVPILFYPDGTTSTAQLLLTNEFGHFVLIELRGLTGIARVSSLLTAEEIPTASNSMNQIQ